MSAQKEMDVPAKQLSLGSGCLSSAQHSSSRDSGQRTSQLALKGKKTHECSHACVLQGLQAQGASPHQQRICLVNRRSLKTCYSLDAVKHWFYKVSKTQFLSHRNSEPDSREKCVIKSLCYTVADGYL